MIEVKDGEFDREKVLRDQVQALTERLQRVEAFLDYEIRQRQYLAALDSPFSHGPLNPWYGACERAMPISIGPRTEFPKRPY